jgi:putative membrane protein
LFTHPTHTELHSHSWADGRFVRDLDDEEDRAESRGRKNLARMSRRSRCNHAPISKQENEARRLTNWLSQTGKPNYLHINTGERMEQTETSPTSKQLGADRTWMAHERTLMAWIRTATSMIGFGFTVYKFFEGRPPSQGALLSSRDFAILMIGFGLIALMLATLQHVIEIRSITDFTTRKRRSIALVLSILLAILGTLAFVSAVFRE